MGFGLGVKLAKTDIPHAWEQLDFSQFKGTLLVVGAPDVGKSTFSRYIYQRLQADSPRVAYLDGDPGQGSLGPPTTMTLALGTSGDIEFPPRGQVWRIFVGAVSPARHMLPIVVGAARLAQSAYKAGAEVIVYDTTGLIDPAQGGVYLKQAEINLLRPTVLFAIQQNKELEYLLRPLRRGRRVHVIDMRPSLAVQWRDPPVRKAYRAEKFALYFANAQPITVDWTQLAIFPAPDFSLNRLVALEDADGFTVGLGIVIHFVRESRQVTLLAPLESMDNINALHLGDVDLDPQTFRDLPAVKRR